MRIRFGRLTIVALIFLTACVPGGRGGIYVKSNPTSSPLADSSSRNGAEDSAGSTSQDDGGTGKTGAKMEATSADGTLVKNTPPPPGEYLYSVTSEKEGQRPTSWEVVMRVFPPTEPQDGLFLQTTEKRLPDGGKVREVNLWSHSEIRLVEQVYERGFSCNLGGTPILKMPLLRTRESWSEEQKCQNNPHSSIEMAGRLIRPGTLKVMGEVTAVWPVDFKTTSRWGSLNIPTQGMIWYSPDLRMDVKRTGTASVPGERPTKITEQLKSITPNQ